MMRSIHVFMGLMMRVYRRRTTSEVDIGLENNVAHAKTSICLEFIYSIARLRFSIFRFVMFITEFIARSCNVNRICLR